ncbi:javelin [Haematobia irritans]|uniref:javelin n=1 Tax=Haematobia irritans TaxID=7368 RepID=UPI003F4F85CC
MGNTYIRTSQTRREDKRKSKEYIYNYVDRVRFAEGSFPDHQYPSRGSGWRHNKSISHLDLATSCHSAASGLNHWPSTHPSAHHHQLRHSRSLDYNHIDRCKDALDIAEYYWRLDHDPEIYEEEEEIDIETENTGSQLKYVSEHHHYRDFKCADENFHNSVNAPYQKTNKQQQQQSQQSQVSKHIPSSSSSSKANIAPHPSSATQSGIVTTVPAAFEFASDSCSLRRSRSLAVIREETFSDLQISSSNGSRRSQLIPRARLVNRGYFRERDRLIYGNSTHHHHHHASRDKLGNCSGSASGTGSGVGGALSSAPSVEADEQSNPSVADTCESHQQQQQQFLLYTHQQQLPKSHNQSQQHLHHYQPNYQDDQQQHSVCSANTKATSVTNDYYDHLKRLDRLALGLVADQLHPWHNDKSDLESLNSDYFKNSLHQSHELRQQHYDIETLEEAVNLLSNEKPRIYQSRRQKLQTHLDTGAKQANSATASGGDSCPENSQSSVFPETTTSNSDDQSDSGSLSEQEYDITKIEEIYQKTHIEGDADSYEIISLTTTTRTRFESTGDECDGDHQDLDECDCSLREGEDSNQLTTTDTEVESTLKRVRTVSENLQKIIAYDSVYLSSEESSDSTLVETEGCETSLELTSLRTCFDEVETVLHISIEDAIYEPKAKHNKVDHPPGAENNEPLGFIESVNTKIEILAEDSCEDIREENESPIYTQVLKIEHTPTTSVVPHPVVPAVGVTSSVASKPKILSVVEKRKLKRYSDSAYSSIYSDSSERTHGSYPSNESSAFAHHLKRQVAEPLYIPLKSNLCENQYHSLPDVNIGQILKVSESIDAQLRSCYNLDNYHSLDETINGGEENTGGSGDSQATSSKNYASKTKHSPWPEEVTSEQIYDSIKRFGRAHQKYRQKEIKENQLQISRHETQSHEPREQTEKGKTENVDIEREPKYSVQENQTQNENHFSTNGPEKKTSEDNKTIKPKNTSSRETTGKLNETSQEQAAYDTSPPTDSEQYHSFEKSKEAPVITVENFSQQIERRAKEIRQSGRRSKQLQIEFANRAKFRLENTLTTLSEGEETKAQTKDPTKTPIPTFRIVVTDAQNNIIEEDSIERGQHHHQGTAHPEEEKENHNFVNQRNEPSQLTNQRHFVKVNKDLAKNSSSPLNSVNRPQSSLKRAPSKPKRQHYPANLNHNNLNSGDFKRPPSISSPKAKERRVLSNQIYRARPVKVITATDSFRRHKAKQTSSKMSRPQILQVIDNKRKSHTNLTNCSNSATSMACNQDEVNQVENEYFKKVDAVRCYWSKLAKEEEEEEKGEPQEPNSIQAIKEPENRKQFKAQGQEHSPPIDMADKMKTSQSQVNQLPEKRHFILGAPDSNATSPSHSVATNTKLIDHTKNPEDFCSFMPSIEIVELDGDKKATIVSAVPSNVTADDRLDAKEPQFDHIRYKVMKSQQLLRSNLLARNSKEAQFDGLIQYLQEYSFQELLSNNNVVIVEPVRTKIERPLVSSCFGAQHHPNKNSKAAASAPPPETKQISQTSSTENAHFEEQGGRKQRINSTSSNGSSSGIKRHFFYQPVRVNRELYEEELPNPDTVRNVRKFFEEHILPTPGQGLLTTAMVTTTGMGTTTVTTTTTTTTATLVNKAMLARNTGNATVTSKQSSPKSRRARKYRYLTIDTSYGHTASAPTSKQRQQTQEHTLSCANNRNSQQSRKWDTASLSSGVSSGDLSSPCESNEADAPNKVSQENDSQPHCDSRQGVHVQDIVKQHNNTTVKKSRSIAVGIPVRSSSVRTRGTIQGATTYATLHKKSGKTNVYRSIYELHAFQRHHNSDNNGSALDDEDDVDDGDDEDDLFGDADDDDNELCDTYYVSNDVLRKIRECGSSVTYYGGRVVQTSTCPSVATVLTKSMDPSHQNNNAAQMTKGSSNNKNNVFTTMTPHNPTMLAQTQTRARAREIETCVRGLCYGANECSHNAKNRLQQKKSQLTRSDSQDNTLPTTTEKHQNTIRSTIPQDNQTNSETSQSSGVPGGSITFKLVKSNSCSSRLELAGADIEPEETEVVRKIVHQFEASNSNKHQSAEVPPPLTINNQTPISPNTQRFVMEKPNHPHTNLEHGVTPVTVNNHINVAQGILTQSTNAAATRAENGSTGAMGGEEQQQDTFQSEAKDIHLDGIRMAGGQDGLATSKICRNKNVDLAFTLVKQRETKEADLIKNAHVQATCVGKTNSESSAKMENSKDQGEAHDVKYENKMPTHKKSSGISKADEESLVYSSSSSNFATAEQIIVPVEIHRPICDGFQLGEKQQAQSLVFGRIGEEKYPLSTTSSVTSVIDKSVVKHYVANDRSIYEKRKYDDIEFEEFEVYDPTKEFEKLSTEQEQQTKPASSKEHHVPGTTSNSLSSNGTVKSQVSAETDCYDSLDDKL